MRSLVGPNASSSGLPFVLVYQAGFLTVRIVVRFQIK